MVVQRHLTSMQEAKLQAAEQERERTVGNIRQHVVHSLTDVEKQDEEGEGECMNRDCSSTSR